MIPVFLLILSYSYSASSDNCYDAHQDCRLIAAKCLSPSRIEQKLMEISCPLTCGYCLESKSSIGQPHVTESTAPAGNIIAPSKCIDEADDCEDRMSFCQRKFYKRMMSLQCAKTCKFCDPDEEYEEEEDGSREMHLANIRSKIGDEAVQKLEDLKIVGNIIDLIRNSTAPAIRSRFRKLPKNFVVASTEITALEECVDRSTDCKRNQKLCAHKAYTPLLQKICAKTCEYCGQADSTYDVESSGELT